MYYAATIITMSGVYDKSVAVWMASATAILNFLINFLGIYLVEKIGRRLLTLVSLVGVVASLGFLAIAFQVIEKDAPMITYNSTDYGPNATDEIRNLVDHCRTYTGMTNVLTIYQLI